MKLQKHRPTSLRTKLVMIILAVLIPLNVMLIVLSQRTVNNVWKELLSSYEHELGIYMTKMDDELENMDRSMKTLMEENWPELNPASDNYEMVRFQVWSELQEVRQDQDLVDAAYLKPNWDNWTIITHDTDHLSVQDKDHLQAYFQEADMEAYQPLVFEVIDIQGIAYIVTNVNYYEYSFGLLTRVDTILEGVHKMQSFEGEHFFLTDQEGSVVSDSSGLCIDLERTEQRLRTEETEESFQVIHYPFGNIDYELVRVIPTKELRASMPQMERLLQIFCIISLLLAPIMFVAVRRLVLKPMNALNHGMQEIENENLDFRMGEEHSSSEFRHMNLVFNDMVEQIHTLKIEAYEQDIEKLKMEATNLRLQINPHLLLNSLNMIYSLAQSKNYSVITEYTQNLVQYFRYSLRQTDELVPLRAEMGFVKHYLDIQRIRFPNAFTSVYEIEDGLDEVLIPPLIIENFVENSMKYALKMGETIEIILVISSEGENMTISIVDTGNGMRAEVLEKIRNGEPIVDRIGNHIGILNCRRRLKVFYGDDAKMTISSAEGEGTQVWMQLPIRYSEGRQESI